MPNIKAHAAIKVTNSMMFVWGGYNEKGDCTDTSLLIDVDNKKITHFETKGNSPKPRAHHKMVAVKENVLCLFGGVVSHEENFKSHNV
mmetsp:Transcript_6885/g.6180  ORF Transcript_6885/g.6180 Transcript_6885/m.6180 type:complete len:88 (+) Transcript_6885:843-1106(+)